MNKKALVSTFLAMALLLPFAFHYGSAKTSQKTIVLGFDGIDPVALEEFMAAGELPNFSKLAKSGTFSRLATTTPPQSPVAWASFITGANPGRHNVFDFLTRDPETYGPKLTITEIERPESYELAGYNISLKAPIIKGYRKGKPFWEIAKANGVDTTALLVPVTFPPDDSAKMLSGMGAPDVTGSNGVFTLFTTDVLTRTEAEGGRIEIVRQKGGAISAQLYGPANDLVVGAPETTVDFTATVTGDGKAKISIAGGEPFEISVDVYSKWRHIEFHLAPLVSVKAIVRFLLLATSPEFTLYVSPINFDPEDPALKISNPEDYSQELAEIIGPFYTQGMPEDTWALTEKRISDKNFLDQTSLVQVEREKMFFLELQRLKAGILVGVFVSSDRVSHMFWRYRDKEHPLHDPKAVEKYGDPILNVYKRMDQILGRTMKYIDDDTTLFVLSDHGFTTFRRSAHINRWLIANGFMTLRAGSREGAPLFANVDWSKTKAFAIGLNGIYLNMAGREKHGIVKPEDAKTVKNEIAEKLAMFTDGADGPSIVRRVFDSEKIYSGPYTKNGPDLVIGYQRGYRSSWQTALGGAPEKFVEDNLEKWSGDHMVDPELVPGVLLSNRPIVAGAHSIMDLAPTILSLYGIKAEDMDGKTIKFAN